MLAGFFVDLRQTRSFKELFLNLEVIAIAFGKVTEEPSRSAITQGVDQRPNSVIYKFSVVPNFRHNDFPHFV
jgi:hypothetical protein